MPAVPGEADKRVLSRLKSPGHPRAPFSKVYAAKRRLTVTIPRFHLGHQLEDQAGASREVSPWEPSILSQAERGRCGCRYPPLLAGPHREL